MLHSIIIPYYETREDRGNTQAKQLLDVLLYSVHDSFRRCGFSVCEYEIVISNQHRVKHPNKPAILNDGIRDAKGHVLTFIDADSIVGPRFAESATKLLSDPALTKMCYRVRRYPRAYIDCVFPRWSYGEMAQALFAKYETFEKSGEAYDAPHQFWKERKENSVVFGNSHFSITREKLGDVRWDESFLDGRMEDAEMNRRIAELHGAEYKAEIATDPEHAMLTLDHERRSSWNATQTHKNNAIYWSRWNRNNAKEIQR